MKIISALKKNIFSLSFEVFPPKREGNIESLYETVADLKSLKPHFISVTYGAGGSTRDKTIEIAAHVNNSLKVTALAHLTCVHATKEDIAIILDSLVQHGIENILALRGDPPQGEEKFKPLPGGFVFACDLVSFIADRSDFCIGVAGYPEKHVEAPDLETDLINLKKKVDAGADFIITQLFFFNDDFYRFRDLAERKGIHAPIIPGIFPLINYQQIARTITLCGAKIPAHLAEKLERMKDKPEEAEKYGIEYAIKQSADLLDNGVPGLHFYSMNKSGPVKEIVRNLDLPPSRAELGLE
ncbi:MAG: methylenetetrahydrofolate reductase [NAD(P)H] [Syntrophales bacterium]|nr:methylenetetrahydrofolate reductase [NAD(P)H] [Syntrophales bacterium]